MEPTRPVGERIRHLREERGFTQQGLADRAGISAKMISLIERGQRGVAMQTMFRLADALAVDPSHLVGNRERLAQDGRDHGILLVRDAILTAWDLPGLGREHGEAVTVEALERDVAEGWRLYWRGAFPALIAHLPPLITAGRATRRDTGTAAARSLSQISQLTANLFTHAGDDDFAYAIAMGAAREANVSGDPLQYASVAGTLSWIALHQGRLDEAERIAKLAADGIAPGGRGRAEQLTVHGSLLLAAAAPAAAAGRAGTVADLMAEASVTLLRYPAEGDRLDYALNFGRSQMEMQRAHQEAALRRPERSLTAAGKVVRADLCPISFGALQLDKAQAYLDLGRTTLAVQALLTAYGESPTWARHQGQWRTLAATAVMTARRKSDDAVEALAKAAGLRPL